MARGPKCALEIPEWTIRCGPEGERKQRKLSLLKGRGGAAAGGTHGWLYD